MTMCLSENVLTQIKRRGNSLIFLLGLLCFEINARRMIEVKVKIERNFSTYKNVWRRWRFEKLEFWRRFIEFIRNHLAKAVLNVIKTGQGYPL